MTHPMLTWYVAQLAADEQIALAADHQVANLVGQPRDCTDWSALADDFERRMIGWSEAVADHVELHGPQSVLADVVAKRALVALHEPMDYTARSYNVNREIDTEIWVTCQPCSAHGEYANPYPCPTLRILATAYASRSGYLEEWGVLDDD